MPASTSTRPSTSSISRASTTWSRRSRACACARRCPTPILDRADAIELVDLTPDDLIQRLKEGKVYVPKQAERALKHYFSPANLTALRELALRRTAERVDEQLLEEMQARAIPGRGPRASAFSSASARTRAPPASCAMPSGLRTGCTRRGRRSTSRRRAACSSTRRRGTGSPRRCGSPSGSTARPVTVPAAARRIADDVVAYAHKNNVTHIVVGKSDALALVRDPARVGGARPGAAGRQHQRPRDRRRGDSPSSAAAASRRHGCGRCPRSAALHRGPARGRRRARRRVVCAAPVRHRERRPHLPDGDRRHCCALWAVAVAARPASRHRSPTTSSSCRRSIRSRSPIPPTSRRSACSPRRRHRLQPGGTRAHADGDGAASACARSSSSMPSAASSPAPARSTTCCGRPRYQIASMLKVRVVLLLPEDGVDRGQGAATRRRTGSRRPISPRPSGPGRRSAPPAADSDTLPGAKWLFLPMRTGRGAVGILGISRDEPGPLVRAEQRRLLDALSDQGALAIERVHLVEDIDRVRRGGGDRPPALGAADVDLARPQDAARCRDRRRGRPARPGEVARRGRQGRPARHHHRGIGAPQPLHRQPARHDQARSRAPSRRTRRCRMWARSSAARWSGRARSWPGTAWRSRSRPACRW